MKRYFYLDGAEKKGPLNKGELKKLNLDRNTLIWSEGYDGWKPINEIEELVNYFPPVSPITILPKINKKASTTVKKIKYSIYTLLILLTLSVFLGFLNVSIKKMNNRVDINNQINRIFKGNSIVCDGVLYTVKGITEKLIIPKKSDYLKNIEKQDSSKYFRAFGEYLLDIKAYKKKKEDGVINIFKCESGGFEFKKLIKNDYSFELETYLSTNVGFKTNNIATNEVQDTYNYAFNYLIEENSNYYSSGVYDDIENLQGIKNDFYFISLVKNPKNNSYFLWTFEEDSIFVKNSLVYYKTRIELFKIKSNESEIKMSFIKPTFVLVFISFILFFLLLLKNPFKW